MGFQIRDAKGEAIAINTLDKEIAVLWGVEYHPKNYAVENSRDHYPDTVNGSIDYADQPNWYDKIGYKIHSQGLSIQGVINDYKEVMVDHLGKKYKDGSVITLESIYPKVMLLLNTWLNKGYTAHQVD